MIDFNTSQLTWILVGACSIGGTGYLNMNSSIEEVDKKVAVSITQHDASNKIIDKMQIQLDRIEQKIDQSKMK